VIDGAAIRVARARLAEVGEPEAASGVEDEVVRPAEPPAVAAVVERVELAALGIDHLDAAGGVVVRLGDGEELARALDELEAAVVGDVDLAARPHRRAVGAAAEPRDHVDLAVPRDTGERLALDLDEHDRAVGHGHRPLGETQARRDLSKRRRGRGHRAAPTAAGAGRSKSRPKPPTGCVTPIAPSAVQIVAWLDVTTGLPVRRSSASTASTDRHAVQQQAITSTRAVARYRAPVSISPFIRW